MSLDRPNDPRLADVWERARAMRWLQPDASVDALDAEALDGLRDRVDEHLAALLPFAHGETPVARIVVTRSQAEAGVLWERAWRSLMNAPGEERVARVAPLAALAQRFARLSPGGPSQPYASRVMADALDRLAPWKSAVATWTQTPPGESTVACHAGWTLRGETAPSPWEPLLGLWERGVWPLALPDGAVLLYVPLIHEGKVVEEPGALGASAGPSWRLPDDLRGLARRLAELGFGRLPFNGNDEARGWWVAIRGDQVGPMPRHDLLARLLRDEINGQTLLWCEGRENWVYLDEELPLGALMARERQTLRETLNATLEAEASIAFLLG